MATTDEGHDGDLPTWTPDVTDEQLERGITWPGGLTSVPGTGSVVASAGVWDDLGCVVVLYRGEDGLDHDVHVVPRDRSGRWRSTGASSGTSLRDRHWLDQSLWTGCDGW
ncbi:hypothetical protein SAMN06264364_1368 [Quadrisphaera granulorum]|uniref:Uncharacterized protein n=1 Tax=Quadrisphaera granulorum TaxID=317664 RepID=A0A316ACS9_9ACTN|nr:hypothetical protein [Quadrisphaera granulorum]PWJ47577.1 hypothetical protein BXY45_1368 [Quadrisphaera granulorum]SZE98707.1 hypothetical protein SAMN06264364_1368 [Quadrisphaera granulorum]